MITVVRLNYSKNLTCVFTKCCKMSTASSGQREIVWTSTKNNVTKVVMNNPKKLNGWSLAMLNKLLETLQNLSTDNDTKVVILTGTDPYYSAGANLSENITPMHPKTLHTMSVDNNEKLFNAFLDFRKPIMVAANGPAIGATVTSAALCDGILASERATFLTPFARLSVPAEGCSSVHFERILGKTAADRMLLHGEKISAVEAKSIGLVLDVVPHDNLLDEAQTLAETWIREGRTRTIPGGQSVTEYKQVNKVESVRVADSFLSYNFLHNQENFLRIKGKVKEARIFFVLKTLRPLWSRLL